MAKIAIVFGTRPEAVKMAPVVKALKSSKIWQTKVIVTGQHREMLHQVLELFDICPDYDLDIMTAGQSLSQITTRVLLGVEPILTQWRPDWVLVHGDTSTAFAVALAAFYKGIPVAHVEAGLRTNSLFDPFPEEANRRLTDVLASLYFAPTEQAAKNLTNEGIDPTRIFVTGNTVIDALLSVVKPEYQFQTLPPGITCGQRPLLLVTAHRRENWGKPLRDICDALMEVATSSAVEIAFAMHRNPQIQSVVRAKLGDQPNIHLIDAPGYLEFANILNHCTMLVTDSGGLQEEGIALNKPVLVLRNSTERPEGIQTGGLKLIGTRKKEIVREITNLLLDKELYHKMASALNPYGDGMAASRIQKILVEQIMQRGEEDGD